jgi:SAM-dependent methyltransferase
MRLPDRLHCPNCKGRLALVSADSLHCAACERTVAIVDGIADFVGKSLPLGAGTDRYHGYYDRNDTGAADLFARVLNAAGGRWPQSLGDIIEFGCAHGDTTHAIVAGQTFRSLLVLDTEIDALLACKELIAPPDAVSIGYATLSGEQDAVRDAVADTVIGFGLLSGIGDVRAFLGLVHRVLRPGGRAMFVTPNRRFHEAMSLAMAEALVQRRARDGVWPEGQDVALEILSHTKRLLVHRGNSGFLSGLAEKHLFDSELLEDMGRQVGFAAAEMIPMDPDPAGAETIRRLCQGAGAPDSFTETFGGLAAAVGQPFFNLLGRQDRSASMLLWLTKDQGPRVRIFTHRPEPAAARFSGPDIALGGVAPRWSVELLARDTSDGIMVSVGGWCLCNTDILWVRLTLDGVAGYAPVWRPRPDVHEVLNRGGLYHPLNALCSGLASELLFEGTHPSDNACTMRLEVMLASGLIVTGPAPETLVMDEPVVIAH